MTRHLRLGEILLDSVHDKLQQSSMVETAIQELIVGLWELRNSLHSDEWEYFSQKQSIDHPLSRLIHQDPFTRRAFLKPRVYSGDAVLIDFIYGDESIQDTLNTATELGRRIFQYTASMSPASCAVRGRKQLLTRMLDDVANTVANPDVLSIACGHLREAKESKAVKERRLGMYVALDQDEESLRVVREDHARFGVEPVLGDVRALLSGKLQLGRYHFIYSAALFDYLTRSVAKKLTETKWSMLRPGGKLLVANFAHNIKDVGFMETYMAWKLIYRNADEMRDLIVDIPSDEIGGTEVFSEDHEDIVFLLLTRKA